MDTLLLNGKKQEDIAKAGALLREGGLVAIPTETVYGLAANGLNGEAVKRIYEAKGRPSDNPLILHISRISQLSPLVKEVPEAARKLARAFWPGPLTMILPKSDLVPPEVSGGLSTVAVRFPAHPVARAVIEAAGVPLAAPSANLSGRPSPTSFAHVKEDLFGRVNALLDGGDCGVGLESTVITLADGLPRILRPGGVTLSQLQEVLGEVEVDPAVLHRMEPGAKAASPGMKYQHYSPRAEVLMVDASSREFCDYVNRKKDCHALCFEEDLPFLEVPAVSFGSRYDREEQAHKLFSALHGLDEIGAKRAYARMPSKTGVGLAVYNRLVRAAGFRLENPCGHLIVGLTGPSGAGKSTVGALLREAGCAVIDCDSLTRSPEVYDRECVVRLQAAFGEDVAPGGVLNRSLLAERAFASPEGRDSLAAITFPRILGKLRQLILEEEQQGKKVIVLDAPTLFESGLDFDCARILVVTAPQEERLVRILRRDGITKEEALRRFSAQQPEEFYVRRADYVVANGREADLSQALEPILKDWREVCL